MTTRSKGHFSFTFYTVIVYVKCAQIYYKPTRHNNNEGVRAMILQEESFFSYSSVVIELSHPLFRLSES